MKLHSFAMAGTVVLSGITDARSIKLRQSPDSSIPVTGPPGLQTRYPIDIMQSTLPDTFNLSVTIGPSNSPSFPINALARFLVAMAAFQSISETNQFSYYQISGIHGAPFIPWGESSSLSQDKSRGYCPHNCQYV
jgi:hypothetical protein